MLRVHLMQQWFTLSDPAMEEALHHTQLFWEFAWLTGNTAEPDETTILRFYDGPGFRAKRVSHLHAKSNARQSGFALVCEVAERKILHYRARLRVVQEQSGDVRKIDHRHWQADRRQCAAPLGTKDYSSDITCIRQARPEVFYVAISGDDATAFLKQAGQF